jgi:ribosomal subunit interface protein
MGWPHATLMCVKGGEKLRLRPLRRVQALTWIKDIAPLWSETSMPGTSPGDTVKIPLQFTFSNMTPSDAVRARVEELAAKLDRFQARIMSCRVVVRAPNVGERGRLYHVSIDLKLPGHEIAINRHPPQDHSHEDIYVAIRDAFNALARRIEDATRERRGDIKTHMEQPSGQIVRIFPEGDYGFIDDKAAGEIYFHANAVHNNGFSKLKIGTNVRYQAELGDNGLQATIVKPISGSYLSKTVREPLLELDRGGRHEE